MQIYLTPKQLAEKWGMDRSTVHRRIKGIKNEISNGRYDPYMISGQRVNEAAFLDYEKYKDVLNGIHREEVPPFDMNKAIRCLGG